MGDVFNKRNLLIGGAVLVGGLVIYAVSSSSSGGNGGITTIQTGPNPAQLQAATQLQMASISANARLNEATIQASAMNAENNARLNALTLSAGLEKYRIDANAVATAQQIANEARSTELQANLAKFSIDAELRMGQSNNAFQLDYAQIAANTTMSILNQQTQRDANRINALRDIQLGQINAQVQTASLAAQDNQSRLNFLGANLGQINRRNRDDILWLVAGGDTANKTVQSDLSGVAQVFGAAGGLLSNVIGLF